MTLSLRSKLAIGFALIAAVPLVASEQVTSRLVRREFGAWSAREFDAARRLVGSSIAREGDRLVVRVRGAARGYRLREAVLAFEGRRAPSDQATLIREVRAVAVEAGLPLLTVYDASGRVLASAQEPERFDVVDPGTLAAVRDWPEVPHLAPEEGIAVTGLALRVGVPLEEVRGGGFLVGGVLLDRTFLESIVVPDSLALLVLSREGVEGAPPAGAAAALSALPAHASEASVVREALERGGFNTAAIDLRGVRSGTDVQFLLASSRRPLEEVLAKIQGAFLALLVAGLLVAWALAYAISRRWTLPLERLVEGLERVAAGDLGARVDVKRDDELGKLVAAFHAMTRDLLDSRERLVQSERVAAWREIARRLAHEIKNPLSPISLSMETLRRAHAARRADFPRLLEECTDTVLEEVERLRRIVQEFSDFARLPKPRLVRESFHEVIRGVVSLHAGLGEGHRIVLDLEPGEGRFEFDPDQMNRLLVNLVKNAIEATPGGGGIRITTRTDPGSRRFAVEVADTGPGVPAALAQRLGEPYTTSKEGGTGLGLAIVHRIAAEHGGTLRLVNPGEPGARFRVDLPLAGGGSGGGADERTGGAPPPAGSGEVTPVTPR